uniref:REPA_OB_2 domain-containing protein n=1 Tax=Strongyloides venezuelensis TaxID=75913 RepID=A0A0K0FYV9_STRVS
MRSVEDKKTSNNGLENKIDLILVDESDVAVQLIVWSSRCNQFTPDMRYKPVILKSIGVKVWSGGYELTFKTFTQIIECGSGEH